jgi:hypothetical protein
MRRGQGNRGAAAARWRTSAKANGGRSVFARWCLWLVSVGLLVGLGSRPAFAEGWRLQPNANVQLDYDDNVRFTTVDAESAFSTNLMAALRAIRSTEITDVGFAVGLAGSTFSGISELDNTNGYVGLDLGHRLERSRFRLDTRFVSQSTLNSEEATTGLVQVNRQQNQWLVNPGWSYLVSERATLDLAANFQDVSYQDAEDAEDVDGVPLFNYRTGSLELGGGYAWSERLGLTGSLSYDRYEAQGTTNESTNVSALVGAEYQLSETTSLSALVGLRRTEETIDGLGGLTLTRASSGPSYALSLSKRFEAGGGLALEARRELLPSGSGGVLDTTGISANLSLLVRPRWRFALSAVGYRNRSPGGETDANDRTFASVAPSIAYELDEYWRLSAGYRFRWQESDEVPGDAVSNAVFLTLGWTRPWDL